MKKSYYYEPIVTPIANNGSSKFGYKAEVIGNIYENPELLNQ